MRKSEHGGRGLRTARGLRLSGFYRGGYVNVRAVFEASTFGPLTFAIARRRCRQR